MKPRRIVEINLAGGTITGLTTDANLIGERITFKYNMRALYLVTMKGMYSDWRREGKGAVFADCVKKKRNDTEKTNEMTLK